MWQLWFSHVCGFPMYLLWILKAQNRVLMKQVGVQCSRAWALGQTNLHLKYSSLWENYIISQCLSFLISEIGIIMLAEMWRASHQITYVKFLPQCPRQKALRKWQWHIKNEKIVSMPLGAEIHCTSISSVLLAKTEPALWKSSSDTGRVSLSEFLNFSEYQFP